MCSVTFCLGPVSQTKASMPIFKKSQENNMRPNKMKSKNACTEKKMFENKTHAGCF